MHGPWETGAAGPDAFPDTPHTATLSSRTLQGAAFPGNVDDSRLRGRGWPGRFGCRARSAAVEATTAENELGEESLVYPSPLTKEPDSHLLWPLLERQRKHVARGWPSPMSQERFTSCVEFWSSVEYGTFLKGLLRELGDVCDATGKGLVT